MVVLHSRRVDQSPASSFWVLHFSTADWGHNNEIWVMKPFFNFPELHSFSIESSMPSFLYNMILFEVSAISTVFLRGKKIHYSFLKPVMLPYSLWLGGEKNSYFSSKKTKKIHLSAQHPGITLGKPSSNCMFLLNFYC